MTYFQQHSSPVDYGEQEMCREPGGEEYQQYLFDTVQAINHDRVHDVE